MAAVLALAALPTEAAVMQATYAGTVSNSQNNTNEFGMTGVHSLNGLGFTLNFVYNTSLGLTSNSSSLNSASVSLNGGSFYGGVTSPMTAVSLTINGVTKSLAGSYAALVEQTLNTCNHCSNEDQHVAEDSSTSNGTTIKNSVQGVFQSSEIPVPLSLTAAFAFTSAQDPTPNLGGFSFRTVTNGQTTVSALGSFVVQSLTVSQIGSDVDPAPVPLPATAGLLAAGLAGIGAIRARRGAGRGRGGV